LGPDDSLGGAVVRRPLRPTERVDGSMEITREHWREYRRTKDPRLRDLLVTANISLVRQVAGRLSLQLPSCVEVGELESAGAIGLLSAVEHYDPEQPSCGRGRPRSCDSTRSISPLNSWRSNTDAIKAIWRRSKSYPDVFKAGWWGC